ncbi:MAG: CHAP domain-containing protein [Candidatus Dormibacteraeota bacterium]|nr:CHAP domain-containing protein [Candidatus Dormibacteraeota bacterium]
MVQDNQALIQARAHLLQAQAAIPPLQQRVASATVVLQSAQARQAADAAQEQALRQQIAEQARLSYQRQGSTLIAVLDAGSLGQAWEVLAESRIAADRGRRLVEQLAAVELADAQAVAAASAALETAEEQLQQAQSSVIALEAQISDLSASVVTSGRVLGGGAGPVPTTRLAQTSGDDGQCTWYAEQAWVTYSDPTSPRLSGDGADVVSNLAAATGTAPQLIPQPGALVSWERPLLSPSYGHVAFVASVSADAGGRLLGYSVWEMNYTGAFQTDTRFVPWSGPDARVVFFWPPHVVDPTKEAVALFGAQG